jgi:hypothetical protein
VKRKAEATRGTGRGVRAACGVGWGAGPACGATIGSEVPAMEEG